VARIKVDFGELLEGAKAYPSSYNSESGARWYRKCIISYNRAYGMKPEDIVITFNPGENAWQVYQISFKK
jgi:hypothetical protein